MSDFRHALRVLRKTPMFSLAVILTVALAIAGNTTMFSIVNAVLLRPLPFSEPDRLMQVAEKNDALSLPTFSASLLNYLSWREGTRSFESLAAMSGSVFTLGSGSEPEQVAGNRVTPNLLRVLGLTPIAGRAFLEEEERPGAERVVIVGEGLWQRAFGGDRGLVGRTIRIDGASATVVGIAPRALNVITGGDLYVPLTIDPAKENRLNHTMFVVGRLHRGVTYAQAQLEMDAVAKGVGLEHPEVKDWGIRLLSMSETFVSPTLKAGVLMLLCAVGLVLAIACANIANLLLARSAARRKEMALRTAIGAGRGRLVRQLLVESLVLSVIGGVLGLAGAVGVLRGMRGVLTNVLPVGDVGIDGTVLAFAIALTIGTGLVFGLLPAWRMSRADPLDALQQGGRGSEGAIRARLRNGLATAEIALATVLLIGAGLLMQSLLRLQRVDLGFEPRDVVTFQLALPTSKYPLGTTAPLFYRTLLDGITALPGVHGAAVTSGLPLGAGNYTQSPFATSSSTVLGPDAAVQIDWRIVSRGFFGTMGVGLLEGRDFTDGEGQASLVTIVGRATAKRLWGEENSIGRTLHRPNDTRAYTVVGVVADVRNSALNQESLTLYFPMADRVWPLMDVVVRADSTPAALLPALRQRVRELDPDLALANVRTMDQWISNAAAQPRLDTLLLGIFAGVALLIAALGVYGVLAYSVHLRTREIGLRVALGARPRDVLRMVLGEGVRIGLLGVVIGVGAGFALGNALASLVFGVSTRDPGTFVGVAALLMAVALAACGIPARRAARIDPMLALRHD